MIPRLPSPALTRGGITDLPGVLGHRAICGTLLCIGLSLGLAGCGEDGGQAQLAGTAYPAQTVAASEASAPLATPSAGQGDGTSASQSAGSAEGDRTKDAPPRRVERQLGEIADVSPGGFRLGSTRVLIDGSTTVEPANALTEGEPVDVTGYYESDRKTLRATLVRSTRPATEPAPEQAQQTPGQTSG